MAELQRPFVASEPHECKARAEDETLPAEERLVWAQLAVAAELAAIRQALAKSARRS
ncbi:hypothetical protein ABZ446_01715 [Streptomyces sp. NPDC005813]|uniref:hypothetical protein n=1 Tax=Streptomyces sp. NPDC005813 TaxID=3155592 RepID=UPI0033DD9750